MSYPLLIACPDCDLLQQEVDLAPRRTACCARCGVALYRDTRHGLDRSLAFAFAAVVLMVLANALPIASLDVRGQHTETTLWGAVSTLYDQGMAVVAALVLVTTIVAPMIELAMVLYMLVPLRLGRAPPQLSLAFRLAPLAREWGLVDVFMLGVVVSLIKLNNLALVVPGVALWSFAALILMLTAIGAAFNPRELWRRAVAVGWVPQHRHDASIRDATLTHRSATVDAHGPTAMTASTTIR